MYYSYAHRHTYRAPQPPVKQPLRKWHIVIAVAALLLGGISLLAHLPHVSAIKVKTTPKVSVAASAELAQQKILDTEVSTQNLNPIQQQIYAIAKQQFATHATSYDSTVMKYTEGFQESWCADFVSWVRNQAGVPFTNPNSGSWRIPGVATLQDYYQSYNAYYDVGTYTPKLGDVAFYTGTGLSGDNTGHVALVLGIQGDNLITIGGNEGDGPGVIQVRSDPLQAGYLGLIGFGSSNLQQ